MIQYNEILYFDTETTGLAPKGAKWDIDYEQFPRICQLSWIFNGVEKDYIIRPDGWEIPQEATDIHGITNEYAQEHGYPFELVWGEFIDDSKQAKLICGHNVYFDTSVVKSEIMRRKAYNDFIEQALHKGKRIDTMRHSMLFVDARSSNGSVKFPKLEELYAKCFPGESFPAHNALEDTRAVVRCLPVLVDKGIIELAVKEYPVEQMKIDFTQRPKIGDLAGFAEKSNNSHIQEEKSRKNENLTKLTSNNQRLAALMADDNF